MGGDWIGLPFLSPLTYSPRPKSRGEGDKEMIIYINHLGWPLFGPVIDLSSLGRVSKMRHPHRSRECMDVFKQLEQERISPFEIRFGIGSAIEAKRVKEWRQNQEVAYGAERNEG